MKPIRNLCQSIFVQFLLDYPLENERIESHINFLLKNLSYCSESGRLQLLQVLITLMERFPAQVIESYCELIFFALVIRVVNDDSSECRQQVHIVLKKLLYGGKISQSKIKTLLNTVLKLKSQDSDTPKKAEQLLMAKLSALQLMSDGNGGEYKLKMDEVQQVLKQCYDDVIHSELKTLDIKMNKRE